MSDTGYDKSSGSTIDKPLFYGSALVTLLVVVLMLVFTEGTAALLSTLFNFFTDQMGWAYIWITMICFGIMLWLAFGKYKDVKFGGPDAKVEFKTFSWIAMFFCAGIGTALLAWASKEWYYYYTSPPFGIEPLTDQAAEWAAAYPIFHWGPLGWVIYGILAFPIGYAYWNRREGGLRFSTACSGVIGEKNTKGILGKFIDFLLIFGLFGANATTLGSGTPMLSAAISTALGVEQTFTIDILVLMVWSVLFTTSVALGLKKGIKTLSDINLWAVFVLCGLIFIVGPTYFMFNTFTDSIGIIATNFFRMAFYTGSLSVLPLFPIILIIFIFVGFIYSATTIDSSAYSMATVSSKDLKPGHEPSTFSRIFWALVLAAMAIAILNIGSLGAVQTASLVAAFPILIFSVVALWSFIKYLKADQPHLKQPSAEGTKIESFLID